MRQALRVRFPDQLVQGRVAGDGHSDERRLERERGERRDGEPDALAVRVDRDDDDCGGHVPHECPKVVAARHGEIVVLDGRRYFTRHLSLLKSDACSSLATASRSGLYGPGACPVQKRIGVTPGPMTDARYALPLPIGRFPCG